MPNQIKKSTKTFGYFEGAFLNKMNWYMRYEICREHIFTSLGILICNNSEGYFNNRLPSINFCKNKNPNLTINKILRVSKNLRSFVIYEWVIQNCSCNLIFELIVLTFYHARWPFTVNTKGKWSNQCKRDK